MPTTSFWPYELIQIRSSPSASSHGLGTVSIRATARSSASGPVAEGDAMADAGADPSLLVQDTAPAGFGGVSGERWLDIEAAQHLQRRFQPDTLLGELLESGAD